VFASVEIRKFAILFIWRIHQNGYSRRTCLYLFGVNSCGWWRSNNGDHRKLFFCRHMFRFNIEVLTRVMYCGSAKLCRRSCFFVFFVMDI